MSMPGAGRGPSRSQDVAGGWLVVAALLGLLALA
jgi:hypothetical protein